MTRFRFRYQRAGYLRWRCRSGRRPSFLLSLPLAFAAHPALPTVGPWYPLGAETAVTAGLQVGDFVVSEEGDPRLLGHPDIRY